MTDKCIKPAYLRKGDKIAMISPATKVKREYVEGAFRRFEKEGYCPVIMPAADGEPSGSFAGTLEGRVADIKTALLDKEVKLIFCNRGGYGVQQLMPYIDQQIIRDNPKWIVGFSDISALHALWMSAGVQSLHAPMAKHITMLPEDPYTDMLFSAFRGEKICVITDGNPLNVPGEEIVGKLGGGNLAVLDGLASTSNDIFGNYSWCPDILFLEDIGEPIYKVDRMLTRLYMTGVFDRVKALIVGRFTEYGEDLNYPSMEEMISRRLKIMGVNIPVAFGFPVGHVDDNATMIEGAELKLNISPKETQLIYL